MKIFKITLIGLLCFACSDSSTSPYDDSNRQYASYVIGFSTEVKSKAAVFFEGW